MLCRSCFFFCWASAPSHQQWHCSCRKTRTHLLRKRGMSHSCTAGRQRFRNSPNLATSGNPEAHITASEVRRETQARVPSKKGHIDCLKHTFVFLLLGWMPRPRGCQVFQGMSKCLKPPSQNEPQDGRVLVWPSDSQFARFLNVRKKGPDGNLESD